MDGDNMEVQQVTGYSLAEVAKLLGRSPSAVRRWIRLGWVPAGVGTLHQINGSAAYVFTPDDVKVLQDLQTTIKSGPRTGSKRTHPAE